MTVDKKFFLQLDGAFIIRDRQEQLDKPWYVEFHLNGKRIRRHGEINHYHSVKGRRRAAEELRQQLIDKYGRAMLSSKLTDKELLFETINQKAHEKSWRVKTVRGHKSMLKMFFQFLEKENFNKHDIERFFTHLARTKHQTTYHNYWIKINMMLKFINRGHYMTDVPKGSANYTPKKYFQKHQRKKLIAYIKERDKQLYLAICLMYYAALRPKELRLLKAKDIYFDQEVIFIDGKIAKTGNQRYVPIAAALWPELEQFKDSNPNDYLFPSVWKLNAPIGENTFSTRHREILKKLNFGEGYALYSWRHTAAVDGYKAGIPLKELQILFDHHSLDQFDQYLRQLGVKDLQHFKSKMPSLT